MEPITWALVIRLIVEVGWPAARTLIGNAQRGGAVTPEEWAALEAKIAVPGDVLIPQRPA